MTHSPSVFDEGLDSLIPETDVPIVGFVDTYHYHCGDLEVLQRCYGLKDWQFYAAMTYYCANKAVFDAEYRRVREERRGNLSSFWRRTKKNTSG